MDIIEVNGLSFTYENTDKKILDNINLRVAAGEILAVDGVSGCGKSTLCNCLCGLIPNLYRGEYEGEVLLMGQRIGDMPLKEVAQKVGIIFQNPSSQLFSPTVEDELAFGPENLCLSPDEIGERMDRVLRLTGMERYRFDNPNRLSGGQQQLIAIAAVLMMEPLVLVCDEIMSWIDDEGREKIRQMLLSFRQSGGTVVMTDHDEENMAIADRIFYL